MEKITNQRDRLPTETNEQYEKRLRGIDGGYRSGKPRTVAQDKRDARKRRNGGKVQ
mgnify:CR=1 FL=1